MRTDEEEMILAYGTEIITLYPKEGRPSDYAFWTAYEEAVRRDEEAAAELLASVGE